MRQNGNLIKRKIILITLCVCPLRLAHFVSEGERKSRTSTEWRKEKQQTNLPVQSLPASSRSNDSLINFSFCLTSISSNFLQLLVVKESGACLNTQVVRLLGYFIMIMWSRWSSSRLSSSHEFYFASGLWPNVQMWNFLLQWSGFYEVFQGLFKCLSHGWYCISTTCCPQAADIIGMSLDLSCLESF